MSEPSAPDGPIDWEEEEDRVAPKYLAAGDPTGWFEELYAAGKSGRITMPFDREQPHPLLVEWAEEHRLNGAGKNAIVVGCGLGADAEYISSRAFQTTAFDSQRARSSSRANDIPNPGSTTSPPTFLTRHAHGSAPSTSSSRLSLSKHSPTHPADKQSPTSADSSAKQESCSSSPPSTTTAIHASHPRLGHSAETKSKRSPATG